MPEGVLQWIITPGLAVAGAEQAGRKLAEIPGAASLGDLAMVLLPDETHVRTPIMASLTRRGPCPAPF